ncbi:MAG: hypothetical protein GF330_10180 [Candidatus Eisenbacteria bacterium]|nr:hypothetical protein [Candidatus Eisenbacteria bacterium]
MSRWIVTLPEIDIESEAAVGGKTLALVRMMRMRLPIPPGICITTHAYRDYLHATGLTERIRFELARKRFSEMRWEEVWDTALRIRSLFGRTPLPLEMADALRRAVSGRFGDHPLVVRSSAPGEDAPGSSFAGLHESFVNVRGPDEALERIRRVWASLWSDAALLYRRELGLDVTRSAMAVLVQELVVGEASGVSFTASPVAEDQAIVEAVHGLNQGLVDGTITPDRWIFARESGALLRHEPAVREQQILLRDTGTVAAPLSPQRAGRAPLTNRQAADALALARRCEITHGTPQDVEWTSTDDGLLLLQTRPITARVTPTPDPQAEDRRPWYRSLTRSFANLRALRTRIEEEILPGMQAAARALAEEPLRELDDPALATEIERRREVLEQWRQCYWEDLIPFAHGMRLFGQYYNDVVRPEDPHEFVELLVGGELLSLERNRLLESLAAMARADEALLEHLARGDLAATPPEFRALWRQFEQRFAYQLRPDGASPGAASGATEAVPLLRALARAPQRAASQPQRPARAMEEAFLQRFSGAQRDEARARLELARASYRLRDDDNVYLGRIQAQLQRAADEGRARLRRRGETDPGPFSDQEVERALRDASFRPRTARDAMKPTEAPAVRPRQIVGQPAGPGIAQGPARVVQTPTDLRELVAGEILVCDALSPAMTHVIPLVAGLVERRGGMLIHGAIIAREYGLPCVTGVPGATGRIRSGQRITVDGFTGIVTIATHATG